MKRCGGGVEDGGEEEEEEEESAGNSLNSWQLEEPLAAATAALFSDKNPTLSMETVGTIRVTG